MFTILTSLIAALRRRYREAVMIDDLLRLNDHLLADMGLRRDQLQPDGIRELDAPPRRSPTRDRPTHGAIIRPSLQGCG